MDVGRALVDRIQHDLLQIAHHRRVVDLDAAGIRLRRRGFLVREVEIEVFRIQHCEGVVGRLAHFLDQLAELVVLDDDRLDCLSGLELDLIQRLQVRGVGGAHVQLTAALEQRDDAPLQHQLAIEQSLRQALRVHRREIQIGETERACREFRDLVGLEAPSAQQLGHK